MNDLITTKREKFWIAIMRFNALEKKQRITKKWTFGKLEITFDWREKNCIWGRFGGGWNWKLGFLAGGRTIIINLLICTMRFNLKKEKRNENLHSKM